MILQKPAGSHASSSGYRPEARPESDLAREPDLPTARLSKRKQQAAREEGGDGDRPGGSKASPPLPPAAAGDIRKHKASVFSRISFPGSDDGEGGSGNKKQKVQLESGLANGYHREKEVESSSGGHRASSNGQQHHHHKDWKAAPSSTTTAGGSRKSSLYDQESSDEEYHFKRRRPSRHESAKYEEEPRHGRGAREREHGSKHR